VLGDISLYIWRAHLMSMNILVKNPRSMPFIHIYIYIFQLSFLKQRGSQEDYRKLKLEPQLADHMGITPDGQNQKAQT
jgi:hypothetical protein